MKIIRTGRESVRGSFTVEASFIASFTLIVLFFVFRMTFFLTDTVRLEAGMAQECLLLDEGQAEEEPGGFFQLPLSAIQTDVQTSRITVSADSGSFSLLPGKRAAVSVEYVKTRQDPVSFVRKVRSWVSVLSGEG